MFKYLKPYTQRKIEEHSREFFHMIIVGRSGCGKTRYLLELLSGEFFTKFNAMFLICPTFNKNQTYNFSQIQTDDKFYVIPDPIELLEESISLARQEASKYHRSLIIFDDVIGTGILNKRASKYVSLLIGGRHDGVSTITVTQQLTSIAKPARDQMTRIISFYNADSDDRRIMFDKYLVDTTKEERSDIINHLRTKDYAKIDIDILRGMYKLR